MAENGAGTVPHGLATTAFAGVGSASAQAQRQDAGLEEIPEGEERGSTLDAGQGDVVADGSGNETQSPTGLQAEAAQFTTNGSVLGNMVASPTGPVPVSMVAGSPEEAQKVLEDRKAAIERENEGRNPDRRFSEEEVNLMDGGTLRAIAARRGYNLPGAGTRGARREFIRLQEGDKTFQTKTTRRQTAETSSATT